VGPAYTGYKSYVRCMYAQRYDHTLMRQHTLYRGTYVVLLPEHFVLTMAKKSVKLDDITEIIEDTIEKKLDLTIERIILKLIPTIDKIVKDLLSPQLGLINKRQVQLEQDNEHLRLRLDQFETELRLNSLIIHGLPQASASTGEKTSTENEPTKAVMDLCNTTLGLHIEEADVVCAYRLQKKGKDQHRPVLIKFETRGIRNLIYRARLKLRKTSVYINEHLTALNAQTYAKARALVKSGKANSTWTMSGQTYIRLSPDPGAKVTRIRNLKDLQSLFPGMDLSSTQSPTTTNSS